MSRWEIKNGGTASGETWDWENPAAWSRLFQSMAVADGDMGQTYGGVTWIEEAPDEMGPIDQEAKATARPASLRRRRAAIGPARFASTRLLLVTEDRWLVG